MNLYKLESIRNSKILKNEFFLSRSLAEKHLEKLLDKHHLIVEEVIMKDNNHSHEFVCDNYNRFFIKRITA